MNAPHRRSVAGAQKPNEQPPAPAPEPDPSLLLLLQAAQARKEADLLRGLLIEAMEMADHWPGIAYSYDLTERVAAALRQRIGREK